MARFKNDSGLGTRSAGQLIQKLRTPEAIFRSSAARIEGHGLARSLAQSIASGCAFEEAADQQNKLAEFGSVIIPITDPRYPQRLREIYDPPVLLFARGRVGVAGYLNDRRCWNAHGPRATVLPLPKSFSADLAASGAYNREWDGSRDRYRGPSMPRSIAGGATIAVFGCGVDLVYPAENRKLAASLAEKGLVLSEFPMGAPPIRRTSRFAIAL